MARIHLNARKVESLQAGPKRIQVFDKSQPNLALRIAASGVKSWSVVYKWNGRMKRLTIGTYPAVSLADARNRAFDALRNVARGDDPQAQKISIREAGTFADVDHERFGRSVGRKSRQPVGIAPAAAMLDATRGQLGRDQSSGEACGSNSSPCGHRFKPTACAR